MNNLIWLLIALIILLVFLIILITKITVHIDYYHHNDNDDLKIEFKIWFGLIKYKMKVPLIKIDDNSPSIIVTGEKQMGDSPDNSKNVEQQITPNKVMQNMHNVREILNHVVHMGSIVKRFLSRVSIKQFDWHTLVGVGDAAATGVLSGAFWTIKGSMVGILSHFLKLKEMPNISVTPHFQLAIIQTRITCIIQFRIGHAILAGLKLIKFWKGGRPNLRMNENYSKEKTKSV
ncbi:DUF2953 domain-containing protein [Bacillus sp. MRMR6]|uniref:DUF2953 domain-containing protein n=1 Tax=Bacillus sp. MRMR6 TaxID=1928617 RepID=UPI0020C9D962|nr:DUF2953 domain-containing protein [Bacillus sp. MRMR6]